MITKITRIEMRIECVKLYKSDKIFDGHESEYYNQVSLPDFKVSFLINDFKAIEDLLPIVGEKNFQNIISEIEVTKPSKYFPNSYSGSDGLPLCYIIQNDLLIIVSSGEFQPQRFKIYLEGVWRIKY